MAAAVRRWAACWGDAPNRCCLALVPGKFKWFCCSPASDVPVDLLTGAPHGHPSAAVPLPQTLIIGFAARAPGDPPQGIGLIA